MPRDRLRAVFCFAPAPERKITEEPDFIGAPRPMRMGTIASPSRYDAEKR